MRLYLECAMGASGDMLMAALYELLPDKDAYRKRMERLKLPGVTLEYAESTKCGITGTRIIVKVGGAEEKSKDVRQGDARQGDGSSVSRRSKQKKHPPASHKHYSYDVILDMIRKLELPDNVLEDSLGVYEILGLAEAKVHGVPLEKVHLHEIGSLDAIADIVGCCLLINMLGITEITASPVNVGFGSVQCEHGILPVPAPAAAEILKGVPIYGGRIEGELCTPTGAALLKRFVSKFGRMPPMTVIEIGCGMGAKDFDAANCLRAFLCEDETSDGGRHETVFEISCNLDDMTPEAVGAALEVLFDYGALDVFTTPIMMKKNRPAVMLTCLCYEVDRDEISRLIFEHTSTLGVRIVECRRDVLMRTFEIISTEYGKIRVKHAHGFGAIKYKPEYIDVIAAASRHDVPFTTVHAAAMLAVLRK